MAKRNGGRSIPAHRLIILVIPVMIAFAAYIGFGALMQRYFDSGPETWQPHWFVIIFLHFCILIAFCGTFEVIGIHQRYSISCSICSFPDLVIKRK